MSNVRNCTDPERLISCSFAYKYFNVCKINETVTFTVTLCNPVKYLSTTIDSLNFKNPVTIIRLISCHTRRGVFLTS